jgi:hypothetical protein
MNLRQLFFILLPVFIVLGCQTLPYQPYARNVKKRPEQGGVIALNTEHREEDLNKAKSMMASNCGRREVKIIEEGEVVVGEKTDSHSDQTYQSGSPKKQVGSLFGVPVMAGTPSSTQASIESTKTQLREWQIAYECFESELPGAKAAEKADPSLKSGKLNKIKK